MRLQFELDPAIIQHLIHSQAGSIGKALIELVMNAVDAGSPTFDLTVTAQGFDAVDAGQGFASRDEVIRYFGRFGTPHQEGDATFGRFRLGRGQIMAHAKTRWQSNAWQMDVDTATMGYGYELDDLDPPVPGCHIHGTWYTPLESYDLHGVLQELRDLIRYTPMSVTLNGTVITHDPAKETWDHQDELAYYRLRREGAMALYNQGVLVRHDPGQAWGVGGIVVSKQALDLNISRTEILRKTCPVWQALAPRLKAHAATILDREPAHRQSESARACRARDLLMAEDAALPALAKEKVFTLLPGMQHVSLVDLQHRLHQRWAMPSLDVSVTRAEVLAQSGMALVFHPRTLERFECYSPEEFEALLASLWERTRPRYLEARTPTWVPYPVLDQLFIERTEVVPDRQIKDAETRRAWGCLRRALHAYIRTVLKAQGRAVHLHVLVGQSNAADAWTDGQSYIAIHKKFIDRLSGAGLAAAYAILTLVDHELAHEGESMDAVHDEAFYARYHDLSQAFAEARHRAIQAFLAAYSNTLAQRQLRQQRRSWANRHAYHLKRINQAREPFEGEEAAAPLPTAADLAVEDAEDAAVRAQVNLALARQGLQPPPVDDATVATAIATAQAARAAQAAAQAAADARWQQQMDAAQTWWRTHRDPACPDHVDPSLWHQALADLDERAFQAIWVWRQANPQAPTWPDHLAPDQLDCPAAAQLWDQAEPIPEEWEPEPEWDEAPAEWQTTDPEPVDPATFEALLGPALLAEVLTETALVLPSAELQQELGRWSDPETLVAFARTQGRWPQDGNELWHWHRQGQPNLGGQTVAQLETQAFQVGLSLKDYLAWRTSA